jgi:hypothetical protein
VQFSSRPCHFIPPRPEHSFEPFILKHPESVFCSNFIPFLIQPAFFIPSVTTITQHQSYLTGKLGTDEQQSAIWSFPPEIKVSGIQNYASLRMVLHSFLWNKKKAADYSWIWKVVSLLQMIIFVQRNAAGYTGAQKLPGDPVKWRQELRSYAGCAPPRGTAHLILIKLCHQTKEQSEVRGRRRTAIMRTTTPDS